MTSRLIWLIAAGLIASACTSETPVKVELPPSTPALREEEVQALEQPQMEIIDLHELPSADKKRVTLTGTLRNRGTGPTHQLLVRVEGRDENDAVLLSAEATPSSEVVNPGEMVTFSTTVDNRPDVARYHVETLAR